MPAALDDFDRSVLELLERASDAQLRRIARGRCEVLRQQAAALLHARTAADIALGCPVEPQALLELAFWVIHRSNAP